MADSFSSKLNNGILSSNSTSKLISTYREISKNIRDSAIKDIKLSVDANIKSINKSINDVNFIKGADVIPESLKGVTSNLGAIAGATELAMGVASDDAGAVLKNSITGLIGTATASITTAIATGATAIVTGVSSSSAVPAIVGAIAGATIAYLAASAWDLFGLNEFFGLSGESLKEQISESIEIMLSDEEIDWSYLDDFLIEGATELLDWIFGNDYEQYDNLSRDDQYKIIDPMALDLDGDGIETIGINGFSSILFDHKNNGIKNATGWISPDDAWLVLDRNHDGKIDTGLELFGDNTRLKDGSKSSTGYQALSEFDDNHDGIIDAQDSVFSQLRAWQDKNQDGISQENELLTLSEAKVKALNLNYQNDPKNLGNGNLLARSGSYIKTDGTEAQMGDLHLASNMMFSRIDSSHVELSEHLKSLPNLKGMGRLKDLQFAAADSEQLAKILTQYSMASTKQEQNSLLDSLLIAWARTDYLNELSGFDAKLEMSSLSTEAKDSDKNVILVTRAEYEALMRQRMTGMMVRYDEISDISFKIGVLDSFTGNNTSKLYYATAEQSSKIINTVNESYAKLSKSAYEALLFQTRLKPYLADLQLVLNDTGKFSLDVSNVIKTFERIHDENPEKAFVDLGELIYYSQKHQSKLELGDLSRLYLTYRQIARDNGQLEQYHKLLGQDALSIFTHLSGSDKNDSLYSNSLSSELLGKEGHDYLYGNIGHDYLSGDEGDDALYGNEGNDTLKGGIGNDYLAGGAGHDTYVFELGHGKDTIHDYGLKTEVDTIRFKDINFDAIRFGREGYSLTIQHKENGDAVNVKDFFYSDEYKVEQFDFADQSLSLDDFKEKGLELHGTQNNDQLYAWEYKSALHGHEGHDSLYGSDYDDSLDGGEGDDALYGNNGDDILKGGAGNDYLNGGAGHDTYVFELGHGKDTIHDYGLKTEVDTIRFKDINFDAIRFGREDYSLTIQHKENGDAVNVKDFFYSDEYKVEQLEFSDYTLHWQDIKEKINSNDYNDAINHMNELTTSYKLQSDHEMPDEMKSSEPESTLSDMAQSAIQQAEHLIHAVADNASDSSISLPILSENNHLAYSPLSPNIS